MFARVNRHGGRDRFEASLFSDAVAWIARSALFAMGSVAAAATALSPVVITEPTRHDTDDPAIWIHPTDPARSLVIGTDKDSDGALYVFDLEGKIAKRVGELKRPNNVDVAYGLPLAGKPTDIAVTTERERQRLRVFSLPEMTCVDRGDLVVFGGDTNRAPMGIALYRRPRDGALFAFVGGKSGPATGYIGQYRLEDDGTGHVRMTRVREFGRYSGRKEIESIAVDAELGYIYYSDETFGVRKYAADPDAPDADRELAVFATSGFASDHEGISIYKTSMTTGYLLVSDQQANRFRIYRREGEPGRPHEHVLLKTVPVAAIESDGSEVTSVPLGPRFPHGLFVAMSNGRVFHYYSWDAIAGTELGSGVNPLPRAHAHNDYEHARPLLDALEQGFGSVEADVWLVDGRLLVAHDRKNAKPERTLAALYLEPLRAWSRQNGGRVYPGGPIVTLLVDVKSDAAPTYAALHAVLESYADVVTSFRAGRTETKAITVIVSGNRAREEMAAQSVRFAAYDGRGADLDVASEMIPWISENTEKILGHKWQGELAAEDRAKLQEFADRAHRGGRKVRFWNTPDREDAWAILADMGVDLINTDDLAGLAKFLRRRASN